MKEVSLEQLTTYMNNLFNSDFYKDVLSQESNSIYNIFNELSNILIKYYIVTLDNSEESIKYLSISYLSCIKEKRDFIKEIYVPYIYKKVKEELQIDGELSLKDKLKIAYIIKKRSSNLFYTHCFPGALYEEVNTNGLDINKELFQRELSILERTDKTAYKKGVLCYCELSAASLSYATSGLPERVKFALGIEEESSSLPKKEYYIEQFKKSIKKKIERGELRKEVAPSYEELGLKLLNFYCSSNESCIAVFRDKNGEYNIPFETFVNNFFHLNIFEISKTALGKKIIERLNKIKEPIKYVEELDLILLELENTNPILKEIIELIIDEQLIDLVTRISMPNLLHGGFADGYEIQGGKKTPNEFKIVKFTTPREILITHHKKELPTIELPPKKKDKKLLMNNFTGIDQILKESLQYENIERIEILYNKELNKPSSIPMYTTKDDIILPKNYLISKKDNEYIYSIYSEKALRFRVIEEMREKLSKNTNVKDIVRRFKEANNIKENEYNNEEDLQYDALEWYAKISFDNVEPDKQKQIINKIAKSEPTFILIRNGNKIIIKKDDKEYRMSSDLLVDSNNNAPYNDYYYNYVFNKPEGFKH